MVQEIVQWREHGIKVLSLDVALCSLYYFSHYLALFVQLDRVDVMLPQHILDEFASILVLWGVQHDPLSTVLPRCWFFRHTTLPTSRG